KKLRAPPKKLKVTKKIISIWDKMDEVNAPISLKDWIANDKSAQKDLKDGLRYLLGRAKPREKGKAPIQPTPMVMNAQQENDDSSHSSEVMDSDNSDTESTTSDTSTSSIRSDDTVYDYPYTRSNLDRSSLLSVLGTINDNPIKMIVDSGSSISVISKSFATKLGLICTGDRIHIRTIETSKDRRRQNECEVTVSVPIRIGGKLRPEHMVIKEDSITTAVELLVLLGMTWLEQYDVSIHAKEKLVEIPVKNGANSIMVQGQRFHQSITSISNDSSRGISGDGVAVMGENIHSDIPDEIISYLDEAVPEENNEFRYNLDPDSGVTVNPEVDLELSFEEAVKKLPEEIGILVRKNKNQFAEFGGLGCIKGAEFNITLKPGATPVRSKAYPLTWEEDQYWKKELASMLKLGIIRPSSGSFTSPIFFIKRRTG
ncbi:uncharacterized protein EV154DRAFT_384328, partial [Mucor mucedo]|uniref:uncharacterized protein n=1 Tax=Mucor mucedo TaxID=29922 RepID=UPI00221E5C6A